MTRPTPGKAKEMNYRRLVKEVREKHFGRSRDEFTRISLGVGFMEKRMGELGIDIHRSLFEDYFSASGEEQRNQALARIENYLKTLSESS